MDPASRSESVGLPPGPKSNKIIQTLIYMRNPYGYHQRCTERYGDLYTISAINGDIVVTAHPDGVRALFTLEADHYEPFGLDAIRPVIGSGSLLLLQGDAHKRERKLLTPQFHGARMRAYGELMRQSALDEAKSWRPGEVINIQTAMLDTSLRVIVRAVFGVVEPALGVRFGAAVTRFLGAGHPLMMFFPALQRDVFGRGPWANFLRAQAHLKELIYQQISAARQRSVPGEDILSLLVSARYEDGSAMTDSDVHDQLLTLLLAGHETSAQALSWAFYYLHRDPARLARLHTEIAALGEHPEPETIAAQPYLEAVCQEALRLYPIVLEIPRKLRKPFTYAGYTMPAGTTFAASVFGVHRRPDLYPEPEQFRPERFLARKFTAFEFIAFGGGARRCIGAAFAMYEMKLVLFSLLQRYAFALTRIHPIVPELRGLTLGPKGGVPMRVVGQRTAEKGYDCGNSRPLVGKTL